MAKKFKENSHFSTLINFTVYYIYIDDLNKEENHDCMTNVNKLQVFHYIKYN